MTKESKHTWVLNGFDAARRKQIDMENHIPMLTLCLCLRSSLFLHEDHKVVLMIRKVSEEAAR